MDGTEDFTREIARSLGSMGELLTNIQKLLDNLPDKRDHKDINRELVLMNQSIEQMRAIYMDHIIKYGGDITDTLSTVSDIHIVLKKQNHLLNQLNMDGIDSHIDKFDELYDMLTGESTELSGPRELADQLSKQLELYKLKHDEDFELKDLKNVIDYANRKTKNYNFWKGWKSKFVIVIGIISGVAMAAPKLTTALKSLLALFK